MQIIRNTKWKERQDGDHPFMKNHGSKVHGFRHSTSISTVVSYYHNTQFVMRTRGAKMH